MPHSQSTERYISDCRTIALTFYRHLDAYDHEAMVDLLHPEGVWRRLGKTLGRSALVPELSQRAKNTLTHHMLVGDYAPDVAENELVIVGYLLVFRFEAGDATLQLPAPLHRPFAIQDWRCSFRKDGDTWKIMLLEGRSTFRDPTAGPLR